MSTAKPATPRLQTPTDLGSNATKDISAALNAVLADIFALYMKTKNFHWHMSGPHFRDYHLLLDEHGEQIFGATDVICERGEEGIEKVRELTGGDGTHAVLECVGLLPALKTALIVVRNGGTVSRVGAPQYRDVPSRYLFMRNVTLTGGVAPTRAYIEELMPDVLDGKVEPGKVFDRIADLDGVPAGYRAMADREALKVLIAP